MTKTKVLLVALLALCLVVPAVNAVSVVCDGSGSQYQTIQLGSISSLNFDLSVINKPANIDRVGATYVFGPQPTQQRPLGNVPCTFNGSSDQTSYQFGFYFYSGNSVSFTKYVTVSFNYVEPTPEPTPVPSPYISVTELYSDNLGTVYRLQCMPDDNRVLYSNIVPYIIPAYMAPSYAGELTSSQTSIEYRVPAGGTSEFSAVYVTAPFTVGVISTTITAPPLTPAQNNTFNPIPDQSQKPLTPFTSGTWQPAISSGQIDVISKSPYIALLSNISDSVQLPVMESPQSVRDRLVPPELENITGPLYDLVDGWADFTNWVPRTIADTVVTLYTPFTSAIADCKTILLSMTAQLAELMKPMYILTPVMYLFIPDFVWIGVCMVLVLLILHALAVFIFGYDVTYYYMGRETIVADAVPEFPALEK